MLSQATADRNSDRAFRNLQKRFTITPDTLSKANVRELEDIIRVGGLYRNKARVIKAVGPKTADIVLLFCANKPTIPVDTHVNRVSKRLGLAPAKADYESIRKSLESLYSPEDSLSVHLMLISHGRKFCKARNPLCKVCPVNARCPSRRTEKLEVARVDGT